MVSLVILGGSKMLHTGAGGGNEPKVHKDHKGEIQFSTLCALCVLCGAMTYGLSCCSVPPVPNLPPGCLFLADNARYLVWASLLLAIFA